MNFGKNLLEKYGWKEGQGIGKHADGIVKPIKANLKFDTAGLGHDRAKEFTDHWWERAFNDATQNLNVGDTSGKVTLSIKDSDAVEITTSGFSSKQLKQSIDNGFGYKNTFLKSRSTLHKENSKDYSDQDEDMEPKLGLNRILTDEELFKACGGRTAHKGARHGLKLSGKLSRIEAQEQQILAKSLNIETAQDTFNEWYTVKKNEKHKKQKSNPLQQDLIDGIANKNALTLPDSIEFQQLEVLVDQKDYIIKNKSKKKKKKQRLMEEELSKSMKSLQTESPAKGFDMDSMLYGVLDYSKAIKKEKNRQQKKELKKNSKKSRKKSKNIEDRLNSLK